MEQERLENDILKCLGGSLLKVQQPARYLGDEALCRAKKNAPFQTVIAFPDLYEIGMSNNALKILYNSINDLPSISCDRVFAAAPDFENLLREKQLPLYGLETGMPLNKADILMFTIGFELSITTVLSMLDLGEIPLSALQRGEDQPIVIAGGPCVSNPLPFAKFIDAFWIGEAENDFFDLLKKLRDAKKGGAKKNDLLQTIQNHPSVWYDSKDSAQKTVRNIFTGFSKSNKSYAAPVPSIKVTQHHGTVEIMRGCPNGCRFCQAGFWYRPMRQKNQSCVLDEIEQLVTAGGYKEISLSSLSSGDYQGIENLLDEINAKYKGRNISFQLPSLHISTFSLSLLQKISCVRFSGLTFAVETPRDLHQMAINKKITIETITEILFEAKKQGFKQTKFYFMIGLPVGNQDKKSSDTDIDEGEEIISFINTLSFKTKLKFNINVGVFIPKPHTPFQWAAQMDMEKAHKTLRAIKDALKKGGHKVNYHDPFVSLLEGFISRGDRRLGSMIESAFRRGCRLDAWSEYFKKDVWEDIIEKNKALVTDILGEKNTNIPLPWELIDIKVKTDYLKKELENARCAKLSSACSCNCSCNCGACSKEVKLTKNEKIKKPDSIAYTKDDRGSSSDPPTYRILFAFEKKQKGVFLSHLSLLEVFASSIQRAKIPCAWTGGFNPLVKIDFASPLSLGIEADFEIASLDLDLRHAGQENFLAQDFIQALNKTLPSGIKIKAAKKYFIPSGKKKHSVMSLFYGSVYEVDGRKEACEFSSEKKFRESYLENNDSLMGLKRKSMLAKTVNGEEPFADFFLVYDSIYGAG